MSPAESLFALLKGAGYVDAMEAAAREPGPDRDGAGKEEDLENVRELFRVAEGFPGTGEDALREFLEKMTLAAEENGGEESEAVRLMTLHNAKGLEFDVVFLVGLEDGLLPHSRSRRLERGAGRGAAAVLRGADPRPGEGVPVAGAQAQPVRLLPGHDPFPVPVRPAVGAGAVGGRAGDGARGPVDPAAHGRDPL